MTDPLPELPDIADPWADFIREARQCRVSYHGDSWVVDPRSILWCPTTGNWLLHLQHSGGSRGFSVNLRFVELVDMDEPGTAKTKVWRDKWAKPGTMLCPNQIVVL